MTGVSPEPARKTAAELLREVAAADPEAHNAALARGYGVGEPTRVLRIGGNGTAPGRSLWFWCPGCDDSHRVTVDSPNGWTWDGNETAPTVNPSILVSGGRRPAGDRCHSFLRAGRWEFLADSTHPLAGQTVPMVPLPEWLTEEYVG